MSDELDQEIDNELDQDEATDQIFDDAFAQIEGEDEVLDSPEVEEVEQVAEGDNQEPIEEKPEELAPPEEYLEELKQSGDEKKAKQFESLVNSNQELKAERDEFKQKADNYNVLQTEIFEHAGLNVDQFSDMIDIFESYKTGQINPQVQQKLSAYALQFAQRGLLNLDGINKFAGHPEIAQKVQNLEMDEGLAMQHIQLLEQQKHMQTAQDAQVQQQQQVNQFNQQKSEAIGHVQQKSQQLAAQNPDHAQIEDLIKESFWQAAQQSNNPAMWVAEYEKLYNIAAQSVRASADQVKQQQDTNSLTPNGKSPTNEIPDWSTDNMFDHFQAAKENGMV